MCQYVLPKTGNKCKNTGDPYCTIHKKMMERQDRNTSGASSSGARPNIIINDVVPASLQQVMSLLRGTPPTQTFVAAPASSSTSMTVPLSEHTTSKQLCTSEALPEPTSPEPRQCCVCWEESASIQETPCKHGMCRDCFLFLEKEECPMCRASLKTWYTTCPYGQEFKGIRDHFKVLMSKQKKTETDLRQRNSEITQLRTHLNSLKTKMLAHLQVVSNDINTIL